MEKPLSAPQHSGWTGDVMCIDGVSSRISASVFSAHVMNLHADGDIGFSKEYESIVEASSDGDLKAELAQSPVNKTKNRYMNIVACKYNNLHLEIKKLNDRTVS